MLSIIIFPFANGVGKRWLLNRAGSRVAGPWGAQPTTAKSNEHFQRTHRSRKRRHYTVCASNIERMACDSESRERVNHVVLTVGHSDRTQRSAIASQYRRPNAKVHFNSELLVPSFSWLPNNCAPCARPPMSCSHIMCIHVNCIRTHARHHQRHHAMPCHASASAIKVPMP